MYMGPQGRPYGMPADYDQMPQMGARPGMQAGAMHPDIMLRMLRPLVDGALELFDAGVTMPAATREAVLAAYLVGRGMEPRGAIALVQQWREAGLSRDLPRERPTRTQPAESRRPELEPPERREPGMPPAGPSPRPGIPGAMPGQQPGLTREQLVRDIQGFMLDQASAAAFYKELADQATDPMVKDYIMHAMEDEQKHYRMLGMLYRELTGRTYEVKPEKVEYKDLVDGLKMAMNDEYEAMEAYRSVYLRVNAPRIRDVFFELMTDELEHATRFNYALQVVTEEEAYEAEDEEAEKEGD